MTNQLFQKTSSGFFFFCTIQLLPKTCLTLIYTTRSLRHVSVSSLCAANEAIINRASEEKKKKLSAIRNVFTFEHLNYRGGDGVVPRDISQQMWLLCVLNSAHCLQLL